MVPTPDRSSLVATPAHPDILCLSHLRWNFVYQRPQHLLTRFARRQRVFYVEEPIADAAASYAEISRDPSGVFVVVPHVPCDLDAIARDREMRTLVDNVVQSHQLTTFVLWYYTPMALAFTSHLRPAAVVYDCMDELSAFAGAPAGLVAAERTLMAKADVMLTGGQSLYEAKRHLHPNIHAVPSSVDAAFFGLARRPQPEPADQAAVPSPRIGFFGVLDERLDIPLLAASAAARPDWHFVLVGPVAKIDPATLPTGANLHYLGPKSYESLPSYIAGWDVAVLPFARNDATRFISPTKTPEYLAAGRPVVSTSIRDVVRPYGETGLAAIADTPDGFVAAIAAALVTHGPEATAAADRFLSRTSWDATWARVDRLVSAVLPVASEADVPTRRPCLTPMAAART